jgi:hypothetical protein
MAPVTAFVCGAGVLLYRLRDHGFTDLTGIDPYPTEYFGSGMRILRKNFEVWPMMTSLP